MLKRISVLVLLLSMTSIGPSLAQEWPSKKAIRIIAVFPPGGSVDQVARILAPILQAELKQNIVVENIGGASGVIGTTAVARAPADGYTFYYATTAAMVTNVFTFKALPYDPEKDFVAVSQANSYEFGVAVGAGVPVRELNHLLAWLRANPQQANFGVPATGSLPHFFGLMVGEKAGVKAQVVGYRGSGPLATDLMGGQVPVAFDTFDTLLPLHEAGKTRILAVSSARRSPFAPAIPTFREAGLDISADGWNTFFAPASTPTARVEQLGQAIREVMQDPDTVKRFQDARMRPVASTPAQTRASLAAYRAQWAPVVQTSGYQP